MRQIAMQSSGDDPNAKRHKHKHKCGDTLCKHRKHKKRRKHKKHHHRANENVVESSTAVVKKESNDEDDYDDDDDDDEDEDSAAQKSSDSLEEILLAKNNLTKTVNIKINKLVMKDHDATYRPVVKGAGSVEEEMVSSVTEDSSGSSYVRYCLL